MNPWGHLEDLHNAFQRGLDTREIEADLGMLYDSILRGLQRGGHQQERALIQNMRQEEWDRRRPQVRAPWLDPLRCHHGTWSTTGECQHGKIQGKKAA